MYTYIPGSLSRVTGGSFMNPIIKAKDAYQQMGDSAELFLFSTGVTTYFYTSYSEHITYNGDQYQAVPIKRSGFTTDVVEGAVRCMVQAPVSTVFSQYISQAPFVPIQVEIRRIYLDDLISSDLRFKGTVSSISFERQVATVECVSSMDELNRTIPRIVIQVMCNLALYSERCTLIKGNLVQNWSVIPDLDPIKLYIIGGFPVGLTDYYIGGIAEYKTDMRYISAQGSDWIELYYPFETIPSGSTLKLYAGCDKSISTCRTKFNNEPNFLGMPFVKKLPNPVTKSIQL
jgi:uncharacterized phage protein (TIGR02218 family)